MKNILNINVQDYQLISLDNVYDLKSVQYSLYAIVSVDRMYFDDQPDGLYDHINIKFFDSCRKYECDIDASPEVDKTQLEVAFDGYPYESMSLNGQKAIASDLYAYRTEIPKEFKIEYIGISEKNLVCDRLSRHSTLQKIMAINMANHTNRDLYLILFNPAHFDIRAYGIEDFEDVNHEISDEAVQDFLKMFGISYQDTDKVVALLEASLINIFKPEFNLEYKNSDSDKVFHTLEELYDYEFDESFINIMLKMEDRGETIALYTDNKRIELSSSNYYTVRMKCPFKLSKRKQKQENGSF